MSSLAQLPLIKTSLRADQRIAVLVADIQGAPPELLANVNATPDKVTFVDIGSLPEFHAIRYGETTLDNGALKRALVQKAVAAAIQAGVGLPVFDFIALINWLHQSLCQRPYYGFI
ncbi:hypothetical protein [Limosilactobacillus fermentum]|uniref:hypothetical protein n=1 Tax=Limosilactobacillus fermentum TaxID=1613 RepID=UPI0021CB71D5|nr:hypothetical protein [Limosilactobacillus fermentum]